MRALTVTLLLIAVLLGVQMTALPGHAAPPPQDPEGEYISYRQQQEGPVLTAEEVTEYWTPERMAAAAPGELLLSDNPGDSAPETELLADGPATLVNSRQYGALSETASFAATYPNGSNQLPNWTYPFPFNRGYVTLPRTNAVHGKLYYTQFGGDFVCSGTSVTSGGGNESLVLTAGHCLHAGNNSATGWSTNVIFYPALGGPIYFGTWSYYDEWVMTSWFTSADLRADFGFAVMQSNGTGACGRLSDCIGASGLAWNQPVFQEFWIFGYPTQSPFTGVDLAFCAASTAKLDSVPGTGAQPLGVGCDFTGGGSGGSWQVGAKWGNTGGYANSVNSYKYVSPAQPRAMYGPYFATNFGGLWQTARTEVVP